MCGICGLSWEDRRLIQEMSACLAHRGPDQSGVYTDRHVSLGHQRLSIIDLSDAGKQPIHNEDKTLWLVYNGEIYNFRHLKHDLEMKGHRFFSHTDSEVIVHAYEEYGEQCVQKLNGMFAFAIWDVKQKKLFLARDRLGIKPLYYTFSKGRILFASEIKALFKHDEIPRRVNPAALHDYLTFRCNTSEETLFQGIYKLLPGHFLIWHEGRLQKTRYWRITMNPQRESEAYYKKELISLLEDSVQKRLMSDVPLGLYLSGGVDSGTMLALMDEVVDRPVETFSVGFGIENHQDELARARFLSRHFGTKHHEVIVDPSSYRLLPEIVWHLDEPMCDSTVIPTYCLARETKKHCTVVLTGEGSDEIFAGYEQYKMMMLHQTYARKIPHVVRSTSSHIVNVIPTPLLNKIFKYASGLGKKGIERFKKFIAANDYATQYLCLVAIFDEDEQHELFTTAYQYLSEEVQLKKQLSQEYFSGKHLINNLLQLESETLLPEDLLMKMDKMTMAFGVEARVPFLDYRIVELGSKMPPELKLKGLKDKYILREAMRGIIPDQTRLRKKERFFVPTQHWFNTELGEITKQILSKEALQREGFFSPDYLDKVWKGYKNSSIFYARQLWSLLTFEVWLHTYIHQEKINPLRSIA